MNVIFVKNNSKDLQHFRHIFLFTPIQDRSLAHTVENDSIKNPI